MQKPDFVHCMHNCSFLQGETPNRGGTACCLEGREKFDIRRPSLALLVFVVSFKGGVFRCARVFLMTHGFRTA